MTVELLRGRCVLGGGGCAWTGGRERERDAVSSSPWVALPTCEDEPHERTWEGGSHSCLKEQLTQQR